MNKGQKLFIFILAFVTLGCLNPVGFSPEFKLALEVSGDININPATESVIVFKNMSKSEKKCVVYEDATGNSLGAQYPVTIKTQSSFAIMETVEGKYQPKRFTAGNIYFEVEGAPQPIYSVAAFGVTYITISESQVNPGDPGTVINVDVLSPNGPFEVKFDGSIAIAGTVYVDIPVLNEYLAETTSLSAIVRNNTSFGQLNVRVIGQYSGTQIVDVPQHIDPTQSTRTLVYANFKAVNGNQVVEATTLDGRTAQKTFNAIRGQRAESNSEGINYVEFNDWDFTASRVTWIIEANGGQGDMYQSTYDSTLLTITFNGDVNNPNIQKTQGNAIVSNWIQDSSNLRKYIASVSTSIISNETLKFKITTSGVDDSDHIVVVYKHDNPPSTTTTKYIYRSSGFSPTSVQRGATTAISWYFEYDEVNYVNGLEDSRTIIHKDYYGTFQTDIGGGSSYGYIQLDESAKTFHVGARTNPYYAFDDGSNPWPFKAAIGWGNNIQSVPVKATFLGGTININVNLGSNIVDGHVIEGMPKDKVTYYGVGCSTDIEVYGTYLTIMVNN